MRVVIAYRTKYGAAETCARLIAEKLTAETELVDLTRNHEPDLSRADVVVVGGSVYGGRIQREIPRFCERRRQVLLGKKVALFICCLWSGEKAAAQLAASFPEWLAAHAFARVWLGGEMHPGKLTAVDRLLVRGVPGADREVSLIRREAIGELASEINSFSAHT